MSEADIRRVVQVFEDVGTKWVLVGAHAIGLITEPRATVDFDFIVDSAQFPAVLRALNAEFGDVGVRDIGPNAIELQTLAVDMIRSHTHPLFEEALRRPRKAGTWNVPRPEVLIALKFLAAVSPVRRSAKRRHDVADLQNVYETVRDSLDREETIRLGGFAYPGGDVELREILTKIDNDEPLRI